MIIDKMESSTQTLWTRCPGGQGKKRPDLIWTIKGSKNKGVLFELHLPTHEKHIWKKYDAS